MTVISFPDLFPESTTSKGRHERMSLGDKPHRGKHGRHLLACHLNISFFRSSSERDKPFSIAAALGLAHVGAQVIGSCTSWFLVGTIYFRQSSSGTPPPKLITAQLRSTPPLLGLPGSRFSSPAGSSYYIGIPSCSCRLRRSSRFVPFVFPPFITHSLRGTQRFISLQWANRMAKPTAHRYSTGCQSVFVKLS